MRLPRPLLLLLLAAAAPAVVYEVGAGRAYPTLAALPALAPGDVVHVASGIYREAKRFPWSGTAAAPILVIGIGPTRPIIDARGLDLDGLMPRPRAALQIEGDHVVVEGFEVRAAHNATSNGAGLRATGATDSAFRDCVVSGCDNGLNADGCTRLLIEGCEFAANGVGDGLTHNVYVNGGTSLTVRACWIHHASGGQNLKVRCHYVEVIANRIEASDEGEVGIVDGGGTGSADSNAVLIGNEILSDVRPAGSNHVKFVEFGADAGGTRTGTLYAFGNTFISATDRIVFLSRIGAGSGALVASGNLFSGSGLIAAGAWSSVGGTHNWAPTGAAIPAGIGATTTGADPGFVDPAGGDIRLAPGSSARDAGVASATFRDGDGATRSGAPTSEYARQCRIIARAADGSPDAGAHEVGTAGGGPTSGVTAVTGGATTPSGGGGGGGKGGCGAGAAGVLAAAGTVLALRRRSG